MSPLKPLCDYCAQIPLRQIANLPRTVQWKLGPGSRIQNSDCPFCGVIVSAFQTQYRTDSWHNIPPLSDRTGVTLCWWWDSGPGARGAFSLDGDDILICVAQPSSRRSPVQNYEYWLPRLDAKFDVGRLDAWISNCTRRHSGQCDVERASFEDSFPGLDVVRFIDVVQSSIVELRTVPRYIALSYVWGEVPAIRLTTVSRAGFFQPGGIQKAWEFLPRTIQDAIVLVQKLGVRYLWVDALCLIQDEPDDTARGVRVMDEIYERSWLTIIGASGHNANAGLPGVREGSRYQGAAAIPVAEDVSVGLFAPLDRLLNCSVYQTRAWTFQEQLLARRAVYFLDGRIYFRCRRDTYAEQVVDHPPEAGEAAGLLVGLRPSFLPRAALLNSPLNDFAQMLHDYSERTLTLPGDILRALDGIMRRVSQRSQSRFLQGAPTAAFDVFVVFTSHPSGGLRRRPGFPSYSWAGWKGAITFGIVIHVYNLDSWLKRSTWIVWYQRSPSGVLDLVRDPAANDRFNLDGLGYEGHHTGYPFECPPGVLVDTSRTYPTEDLTSNSIPETEYPLLQFWTLSVHFSLQLDDALTGQAHIISRKGAPVGTISLDGLDETTAVYELHDTFEFILLSRVHWGEKRLQYPEETEDCYYVMLLECSGPVSERRGLGILHVSAVADCFPPGPIWKEIVLG